MQNGHQESIQLEETCKVQINNGVTDNGIDSIQTVESTVVTTENHLQETSL